MTLVTVTPASGKADRREYDRRYYLANRERKIEQAKASYRRRREEANWRAAEERAAAVRRSRPRLYITGRS